MKKNLLIYALFLAIGIIIGWITFTKTPQTEIITKYVYDTTTYTAKSTPKVITKTVKDSSLEISYNKLFGKYNSIISDLSKDTTGKITMALKEQLLNLSDSLSVLHDSINFILVDYGTEKKCSDTVKDDSIATLSYTAWIYKNRLDSLIWALKINLPTQANTTINNYIEPKISVWAGAKVLKCDTIKDVVLTASVQRKGVRITFGKNVLNKGGQIGAEFKISRFEQERYDNIRMAEDNLYTLGDSTLLFMLAGKKRK
jgi:hypothetical protein